MKSLMFITSTMMLASLAVAEPVHVRFTGQVSESYLTFASMEYFGVLAGDEFVCDFVYDPETITLRTGVNTNPLDEHFIQLAPAGETGIKLAVNSISQYVTQTDPLSGSYYMHVIDSSASNQPGRVNLWFPSLLPNNTSISMSLYEQDYQVSLDGSTFPEIHLESLLRGGSINVRCDGYRFVCSITSSEIVEKTPPVLDIDIDIKPGSDRNPINLKSKGVIPVVVYGCDYFDLTWVNDPMNIMLFDIEAETWSGAVPVRWTLDDVDGDGYIDMVLHYDTQELAHYIDVYSEQVCLTGLTVDDILFIGTDTISPFINGKRKRF